MRGWIVRPVGPGLDDDAADLVQRKPRADQRACNDDRVAGEENRAAYRGRRYADRGEAVTA
jgi:hypothetical protein